MAASKSGRTFVAISLTIFLVWLVAYPISRNLPADTFTDPFEPVYNGLNVLFTALAFGGVIITFVFQSDEARIARREEVERSIFELFQTFTSPEFQHVKDCAFRPLIACVRSREYAEYLASRLFAVEQLSLPPASIPVLRGLYEDGESKRDDEIMNLERTDRIMLDNVLNFFSILAQRESAADVIKHCEFSYDWWRPMLWLIGQLQKERYNSESSALIRQYCRSRLVTEMLERLDSIYGHNPEDTGDKVWEYITGHPKVRAFGLDERYEELVRNRPANTVREGDASPTTVMGAA